jgi:hypothetical protein
MAYRPTWVSLPLGMQGAGFLERRRKQLADAAGQRWRADIKTFKPNSDLYAYPVNRGGRSREETWVVSANSFDAIGAKAAQVKAAWIRRNSEAVFDPWE